MQTRDITWKDIVADAMRELGGEAHLSQINAKIEGHPKTTTNPTWKDTIRKVVRQYSIFEPVPPDRSGVYRLAQLQPAEVETQNLDSSNQEINHATAQGMLVVLGQIYGYETFVPTHDQTSAQFQGNNLSNLVTLRDCSSIFTGQNLPQIREIDVLWFNEDDHGLFPVYAFEIEHTTRVKSGLDRLLKIPRRYQMHNYVLGPGEQEHDLFNRYMNQTPFKAYRDRFSFRLYADLDNVYNAAVQHKLARENFGIQERCSW
jgi:hypothetical protein